MEKENGWFSSKERFVRLLITMNMASANGNAVHQITVDHSANSLLEFLAWINDYEFIMAHQYYRVKQLDGEVTWRDRGEIIVNTAHIGKVQEFIEFETRDNHYDESYGYSETSSNNSGGPRTEVRKRRGNV
jgi:hypothetical protein